MATKIESLEALVQLATSKQGGNDAFCDLAFVQPEIANRIERLTNFDVHGFRHSVGESAIRHVLNRHGDLKIEITRGQTIVTPEDFYCYLKFLQIQMKYLSGMIPMSFNFVND